MLGCRCLVGCGMSVTLAMCLGTTDAGDVPAERTYQFGDWVVTVQPGQANPQPASSPVIIAPAVRHVAHAQPGDAPMPLPQNNGSDRELIPPSPAEPGVAPGTVADYRRIYDAIPFSRAEYDANPSYRHDATIELLFGRMRPTVIQRGTTSVNVNVPDMLVTPWAYSPYGLNSLYYPFYTSGYRVYTGR